MPSSKAPSMASPSLHALQERVFAIDRETGNRFSILDREVAGIKSDVHGLGEKIDRDISNLSKKIDDLVAGVSAGRATNWMPLIAAGTLIVLVMTTVGRQALSPIDQNIVDIKSLMRDDYATRGTLFVPRLELDQRTIGRDKEIGFLREDFGRRMDRLQDQINENRLMQTKP